MKITWRLPELTTKAKIIVGLVVFLFLGALIAFVVMSYINGQLLVNSVERQEFAKKDTTTRKSDALSSANSALKSGDQQKAASIYDNAISAEPDATRKVKLAIDESALLYANKKYDDAITIAKQAENYSSDKYLIADWLGQLYEVTKQYDNAITYYSLAGSLASSPTNDKGYDKKFYDQKVKTIKALMDKS